MERKNLMSITDWLILVLTILLIYISGKGVFTFTLGNSYVIENRYGEEVNIFGAGIYSHDSATKVPEQVAMDAVILFVLCPAIVYVYGRCKFLQMDWKISPRKFISMAELENRWLHNRLFLLSLLAFVMYYTSILTMGRSFNEIHLLYVLAYSLSIFTFTLLTNDMLRKNYGLRVGFGMDSFFQQIYLYVMAAYFVVGAIANTLSAQFNGAIPSNIEVYTTFVEHILHLGILAPLYLCTPTLLRKNKKTAFIILSCLLVFSFLKGLSLFISMFLIPYSDLPISTAQRHGRMFTGFLAIAGAVFFGFRFNKDVFIAYPKEDR